MDQVGYSNRVALDHLKLGKQRLVSISQSNIRHIRLLVVRTTEENE